MDRYGYSEIDYDKSSRAVDEYMERLDEQSRRRRQKLRDEMERDSYYPMVDMKDLLYRYYKANSL